MTKVTYCEQSTITEAWAVIIGAPGPVVEGEDAAVSYAARKQIGELQQQPSLVFVEQSDLQNVPPFWRQQFSWEDDKYLARLGHRYLSVHYVKRGDDRYEQYDRTLKPAIKTWLIAYEDTLSGTKAPHPLKRAGFGYVNTFVFPQADFDLSRYFKLDFGIGSNSAKNGLSALEVNFELTYPDTNTVVSVNLLVRPVLTDLGQVELRTMIEAQTPLDDAHTFLDHEILLDVIMTTKDIAKDVFFDLATETTYEIMGARYATNPT